LRRERPTILHTHNPKPGLYGRVVGRLAGVPLVINTMHGLYATADDPWIRRAAVYLLEAVASRFSDLELVQNAEDVETIRRSRLASGRKVRHLGNGVDLTRFRPSRLTPEQRRSIRKEWGVGERDIVVGTVGRLVVEKGYRELFEAIGGLGDGARLVVVGGTDTDKADALDAPLLERCRGDGVVLLGHRADVADLLGAFDIFALASHREGQPRAAMEAAASGLPIVATNIRGCRQVVEHGVTGLLVPPYQAVSLAEALGQLIRSPTQRESMGVAARVKARREFDERDVVARVLDGYRTAAARRRIALGTAGAWTTVSRRKTA
jgi:glycosyltransferase involved in cell wall biosynthesis